MRAFFCLPLDGGVRAAIARAATRVRREARMSASWVEPDNYHVTLRFLGEIDPHATVELQELARDVARGCASFSLVLDTIGGFPTLDRARVLWVGGEAPDGFRALASALEDGVVRLGFPREPKPAVAHVTIARLKGPPDRRLGEIAAAIGRVTARPVAPAELVLMESELTPGGARYAPLFSVAIPCQQGGPRGVHVS